MSRARSRGSPPGRRVTFTVLRGGTDRRLVQVKLAERPA